MLARQKLNPLLRGRRRWQAFVRGLEQLVAETLQRYLQVAMILSSAVVQNGGKTVPLGTIEHPAKKLFRNSGHYPAFSSKTRGRFRPYRSCAATNSPLAIAAPNESSPASKA